MCKSAVWEQVEKMLKEATLEKLQWAREMAVKDNRPLAVDVIDEEIASRKGN